MTQPVVVLACRVLQDPMQEVLDESTEVTYLDFGLHENPELMAPALQEHLDALPEPSTVVVGYGLCGNGVVGVRSGRHTLVLPRTHDCIAMMLGSREAYDEAIAAEPGTYYLTRGWLDTEDDPLHDYLEFVERFGEARADRLIDQLFGNYRKLVVLAFDAAGLEEVRRLAAPVVEFCTTRLGMEHEERIGDPGMIRRLASTADPWSPEEFVIVPPGSEITQDLFV